MWILYAFGAAFFAGITAVLVKIGIRDMDSNLATALRMIVIMLFSWAMVFVVGSQGQIWDITLRTMMFLILSGLSTGVSWLCYFKALQLGDVNKVAPIDRSSTILTMIFAFFLLGEKITIFMFVGMIVIIAGTVLMLNRDLSSGKEKAGLEERSSDLKEATPKRKGVAFVVQNICQRYAWAVFASGSAIFASMTAILGKVGIEGVESNLGTAIRTIIVFVMAWLIVWKQEKIGEIKSVSIKGWIFILLSGISTGLSWLSYYRALQDGYASIIVPIDKLSIVVTVFFSWLVLKEKVNRKSLTGLALIVAGTLCLLF